MAEVVLYLDSNFGGLHLHLYESAPDLTKIALGGTGSGIGGNWLSRRSPVPIPGPERCAQWLHYSITRRGSCTEPYGR